MIELEKKWRMTFIHHACQEYAFELLRTIPNNRQPSNIRGPSPIFIPIFSIAGC